jgi:hypothetical protein
MKALFYNGTSFHKFSAAPDKRLYVNCVFFRRSPAMADAISWVFAVAFPRAGAPGPFKINLARSFLAQEILFVP